MAVYGNEVGRILGITTPYTKRQCPKKTFWKYGGLVPSQFGDPDLDIVFKIRAVFRRPRFLSQSVPPLPLGVGGPSSSQKNGQNFKLSDITFKTLKMPQLHQKTLKKTKKKNLEKRAKIFSGLFHPIFSPNFFAHFCVPKKWDEKMCHFFYFVIYTPKCDESVVQTKAYCLLYV